MNGKYNFQIDPLGESVSIEIAPEVFSPAAILLASYYFIENKGVIVEKEEDGRTKVTIIPNEKTSEADLEKIAYEFNNRLISSSLEKGEELKYSGVRDAMMKAALLK